VSLKKGESYIGAQSTAIKQSKGKEITIEKRSSILPAKGGNAVLADRNEGARRGSAEKEKKLVITLRAKVKGERTFKDWSPVRLKTGRGGERGGSKGGQTGKEKNPSGGLQPWLAGTEQKGLKRVDRGQGR